MADRNLLLESTLNSMPDGLAVFDSEGCIVFWNAAAEAITGHALSEIQVGAPPIDLDQLLHGTVDASRSCRGMQIRARHKMGHELPLIVRSLTLQDELGNMIGTSVLFHPAQRLGALPHGEDETGRGAPASQVEFTDRLAAEFEDLLSGGQPFGILWVAVDQSQGLRRTHGAAACHAMLEKIQHALASGLRQAEELTRWGDDSFLILAHEHTPELLARHACTLADMARTADFRWWGDRVLLTVSVGAAQASRWRPLGTVLERAHEAMEQSMREGGNRVTCASGENNRQESGREGPICTRSSAS
jgi:diguanylate cyclase (GGDEF)-like protein/PAS domain S-box-containing protein